MSEQYRENIEREAEASAAMFRSNQMLLAKHMSSRPKNAVKAYDRRQSEWKEWCKTHAPIHTGELVTDERLAYFLEDFVLKKNKKNGKPLGKESIQQYIKAITDLHNQHRRNNSSIPNIKVRGPLVNAFLDTHLREKALNKCDCNEDRSNDTLGDGYDEDDYQRIGEYFFHNKNNTIGCRDRLCFVLGHSILGRSQTTLGIQLADLYSMKMPQVGATPIIALAITINFSKSNQYGKIEVASSIRHRHAETCSLGSLAFSLFSRFHFEKEPFPDFTCRQNWYKISLFPSEGDPFKSIDYKTHSRGYTDVLSATSIDTSKVTHASRKSAMNIMAQKNVSSDQQSLAGRWVDNRRMGNYNASLPMQAMKGLAGFDPDSKYDYFLPRGEVLPSEELQQMVFPQVDYWINKFINKDGVQEDRAGPKFLKLLKYLRIVFLQDSVILKYKYPSYYLWTCEIFSTIIYRDFEAQLLQAVKYSDGPFYVSQKVQMAVPEMTAAVQSGFEMLSNQMKSMQQANMNEVRDLRQNLSDFFALGNAHFNSNNSQRSSDTPSYDAPHSSLVPFNSSPPSVPSPSASNQWYSLNRNIVTISDVWREYSIGLSGCPAVKDLEKTHGTKWRKPEHESRYFNRRKEIYRAIEDKAEKENISCEESARRLEETQKRLSLSIDQLRQKIKKEGTTNL